MAGSNIDVLNCLLAIVYRSLPMYLVDGTQWTNPSDPRMRSTLDQIVADQRANSKSIAELIQTRGGSVHLPPYPIGFADTHFVSVDYLTQRLQADQQQDIEDIEACIAELGRDVVAVRLAQETLGAAKAHLEAIDELVRQPV